MTFFRMRYLATKADNVCLSFGELQNVSDMILGQPEDLEEGAQSAVDPSKSWATEPFRLKFPVHQRLHEFMRDESERDFWTPIDAVNAAKALLWRRKIDDVPKILLILKSAMRQHGKNDLVALWTVCFTCFVLEDADLLSVMTEELRRLDLQIEFQYLRFALQRSLLQKLKSVHAGGNIGAIGLMEFAKVRDEVDRYHKSCLSSLKRFWRSATHQEEPAVMAEHLRSFLAYFSAASTVFEDMLIKFPNSIPLLRMYAQFQKEVANNG